MSQGGPSPTAEDPLPTHSTAQQTWQKMERHTEHTKPNSMALCSRWAMCQLCQCLIWQQMAGSLQPAYLVAETRGSEVHTSHLGHVQELAILAVNCKTGLQAHHMALLDCRCGSRAQAGARECSTTERLLQQSKLDCVQWCQHAGRVLYQQGMMPT